MIQLNNLQSGHTGFMMAYYQDDLDAVLCASGLNRVFNVPPGVPIDISLSKRPRCSDSVRVVFETQLLQNPDFTPSDRVWTYKLPRQYQLLGDDNFKELFVYSYQYLNRFFDIDDNVKGIQQFVGYITVYC